MKVWVFNPGFLVSKEVPSIMFRILTINPGSSSTKISVFDDHKNVMTENISHPQEQLDAITGFKEQFEFRKDAILMSLAKHNILLGSICAVVGRGGIMSPVESGAYLVNEAMKEDLERCPKYHASNLGASLADDLAGSANAPAFVYDPVSVDEMWDLAKLTGLPGIERPSIGHVLNMRAVAKQWATENKKAYDKTTLIVAHLGSGITLSLHHQGRIVDLISDDEGPFGPERSGLIPARKLVEYLCSTEWNRQMAFDILQGKNAGLHGMLGTGNTIEVEARIAAGDLKARLCYESMAFDVAKAIGQLATEVFGKVERIILTGGTAYSSQFTDWITERVCFIAPVEIMPGEREMEAMAAGVLRVLQGKDEAKTYYRHERSLLL
jgi:butyrate kinase